MISLLEGNALDMLRTLPAQSVHMCVTSPPYWGLRDYGVAGQIGLERAPDEFVARLVEVFREVRRVLRDDGTLWVNLGDSYAMSTKGSSGKGAKQITNSGTLLAERRWQIADGLKPKDLVGVPWRVAFALQADGWYLRSDIIWHKPAPMPESVSDRPTKAHEYIFLLSKQEKYYYNADAIAERSVYPGDNRAQRSDTRKQIEPMSIDFGSRARTGNPTGDTRNRRTVWTLSPLPTPDAHFATFPIELPETCILAGSPPDGMVLDPFSGAGTTGMAAIKHGRSYIGIELNPAYNAIARTRLERHMPLLAAV